MGPTIVNLFILKREADIVIDSLKHALKLSVSGVEEEIFRLGQLSNKHKTNQDDSPQDELYKWMHRVTESKKKQLEDYSMNVVRSSIFLMSYSFLDKMMNEICEMLYRKELSWPVGKERIEISHAQIRGEGLQPVQIYLERIVGIKVPDLFEKHSEMLAIMRNAFTHSFGFVNAKTMNRLKTLSDKTDSSKHSVLTQFTFRPLENRTDKFEIMLSESFVLGTLTTIEEMIENLLSSMEDYQEGYAVK